MVRIKHRYLLVQILYPEPVPLSSKASSHPPPSSSVSSATLPSIVRFHQPSPNDLTPQALARAIRNQIALLYGDYGVGMTAASLNVKYLSSATSTAIVRCARAHYRLVWAALAFMTHLPTTSSSPSSAASRPCVFRVVRVSGTIKMCEQEAIRRARAAILRAKREEGGGGGGGVNDEGTRELLDRVLGPFEEEEDPGRGGIGVEDSDEEDGEMESRSDGE